ncbi:MAG: hypothetical protein SF029_22325 [bacterium]|nr:hypothetical protein [bacterium]
MQRRLIGLVILILLLCLSWMSHAQEDGLNLPTEFYVLLNAGQVQRIGLGSTGVTTITPEDAFVLDFAVAPDGDWLAYRTEEGLSLMRISAEAAPVQIEGATADVPAIRGQGDTMAWTPDGGALAYTTLYGARVYFSLTRTFTDVPISPLRHLVWSPGGTYLAAEAEGDIWWVYRRDASAMNLAAAVPSSRGFAWLDDARFVFAPPEGGLIQLDMANANTQTPLTATDTVYALPVLQADGVMAAFAQDEIDGETFSFLQTFTLDGTTAAPGERSSAPVDLAGARWAPGGRLMMAFREGTISLLLPTTGDSFPLPIAEAVAYGWGAPRPPSVTAFALSAEAYFRALDLNGILQVWRLPRNGLPPETLTEATEDITEYAISGNTVIYLSAGGVWIQPLNGETLRLLSAADATAREVAISPSGATAAFTTDEGVFILPTSAAVDAPAAEATDSPDAPERVPTLTNSATTRYSRPVFAPNQDALIVTVQIDADTELQLYDLNTGQMLGIGRYPIAEWLPDGRLLAYNADRTEAYIVDPFNPQATTSPTLRVPFPLQDATLTSGGTVRALLTGDAASGPSPLRLVEVPAAGGDPTQVAVAGFLGRAHLSPDGTFVGGITPTGSATGTLVLYSVEANQTLSLALPAIVTDFRWAAG